MMTAEVIKRCEEVGKRAVQENLYDGDGLRCGLVEDGLRTDFVTNGWENRAELDEAAEVKKRNGLNLYAFCANNPVMYVNPSGYAASSDKCGTGQEGETNPNEQKHIM